MKKFLALLLLIFFAAAPAHASRPPSGLDSITIDNDKAIRSLAEGIAPVKVPAPAATRRHYKADLGKSKVKFSGKASFKKVAGEFKQYDVRADIDPANPADSDIRVTVDMGSIKVRSLIPGFAIRAMLKTAEFPTTEVRTTALRPAGEAGYFDSDVAVEFHGTVLNQTVPLFVMRDGENLRVLGSCEIKISDRTQTRVEFDLVLNPSAEAGTNLATAGAR